MTVQSVRARVRRTYMTLPGWFDFALELFPGAMMIAGGLTVTAIAVF